MMALLLALDPMNSPQLPRSSSVRAVCKFVKITVISAFEFEFNSCANIFGASDESDYLQDDQLKKITGS